jgi:hypothetical protein
MGNRPRKFVNRHWAVMSTVVWLVGIGQAAFAENANEVMMFHFTLQESCTSGPPGTFTPDGDIMKPAGLGFSHVAGRITFDAKNARVAQTDEAVFQFPPGFDFSKPEGTPQGAYPFLAFKGSCSGFFRLADDLSFTIQDGVCTPVGQNGPPTDVTTTITGMKLKGQFAADLQSFVGSSLGLNLELGVDSKGNRFERYCGKTIQGVRIPKR